jgi:hypothetical protein
MPISARSRLGHQDEDLAVHQDPVRSKGSFVSHARRLLVEARKASNATVL